MFARLSISCGRCRETRPQGLDILCRRQQFRQKVQWTAGGWSVFEHSNLSFHSELAVAVPHRSPSRWLTVPGLQWAVSQRNILPILLWSIPIFQMFPMLSRRTVWGWATQPARLDPAPNLSSSPSGNHFSPTLAALFVEKNLTPWVLWVLTEESRGMAFTPTFYFTSLISLLPLFIFLSIPFSLPTHLSTY